MKASSLKHRVAYERMVPTGESGTPGVVGDYVDALVAKIGKQRGFIGQAIHPGRPKERKFTRREIVVWLLQFIRELEAEREQRRKDKATFYAGRAWRELRYVVLKDSDGRCVLCGATASSGAVLHVDHIKPRSLFPDLALERSNMQVLCADCNIGKSNKDDTDWRDAKVESAVSSLHG